MHVAVQASYNKNIESLHVEFILYLQKNKLN